MEWSWFLSQLKDWVAPGAISLVCFFAIRYITRRDKFESDIEKKVSLYTDSIRLELTQHAAKISHISTAFEKAVLEVKQEAADMRKSTLEFESGMQEKLVDIERQTLGIKATLERTAEKANELEAKVDTTLDKIQQISDKVQYHDTAVSDLVKKSTENRNRIKKVEVAVVSLRDRKTNKH